MQVLFQALNAEVVFEESGGVERLLGDRDVGLGIEQSALGARDSVLEQCLGFRVEESQELFGIEVGE